MEVINSSQQLDDKDVFRSSSLREKDRARAPLSNVFGTEEKRREIQKEIERAQLLIAESDDTEEEEDGSRPDGELDEGTELEKVGFPLLWRIVSKQ